MEGKVCGHKGQLFAWYFKNTVSGCWEGGRPPQVDDLENVLLLFLVWFQVENSSPVIGVSGPPDILEGLKKSLLML